MAWESGLSYNANLADAVRTELEKKTVTEMATMVANDKYARTFPTLYRPNDNTYLERRQKSFSRWESFAASLPHDVLVADCMDRAERTNTADNGANEIWIDKGGCSKVTVG